MKPMRISIYRCFCLVMTCFLVACGLPSELKTQAQKQAGRIAEAEKEVTRQKAKYTQLRESETFGFFKIYAEREHWESNFQVALDDLQRAKEEIVNTQIAALIKENKKESATHLRAAFSRIDRIIKTSIQKSKQPILRMAELEKIKKEAPEMVNAAQRDMKDINKLIQPLEADLVPQAQKDFPKRSDEIVKRFVPLKKLQQDANAGLKMAQTQLDLLGTDKSPDYAILGDQTALVKKNLDAFKKGGKEFRSQIKQLYQSYTKILADMRIDYYVQIGRASWDEASDWSREHSYLYPPSKVEEKAYANFIKLNPDSVVARYTRSWGGRLRIYVDKTSWNSLGIRPAAAWYSRSHNAAEFWVEDFSAKTYHKYILLENGKRKETDWELVDEEDYDEYFDYLGMEIVSKPYGFFEDEKIETASPPGMSLVGNPKYGEWRNDPHTGRSFWYYYGIYSFFYARPGRYFYRNDWDTWRRGYRGRKPYFGGGGTTSPIYGTYGSDVRTNQRYQSSHFAKKGGLKTPPASVRGAGPGRRGGGPGGRGK